MAEFLDRVPAVGREGYRKLTIKEVGTSGLATDSYFTAQVEFDDSPSVVGTPYARSNIATQADCEEGTDNEKLVTPYGLQGAKQVKEVANVTISVASAQVDIDVSSVSSTYQEFKIILLDLATADSGFLLIRFNDNSANYNSRFVDGGSAWNTGINTTNNFSSTGVKYSVTANVTNLSGYDKSCVGGTSAQAGASNTGPFVGKFLSTDLITKINIVHTGGTITSGKIIIQGIKY